MKLNLIDKVKYKINPLKYMQKEGLKIGKNCEIYKNISWGSEPYLIEIGDNCRITTGVKFITHDGGVNVLRNLYNEEKIDVFGKIVIGNNTHIGINSIIMPGVRIGNNCIIGCGSVVTKNVDDNTVVAGIPARKIETIEEYYNKVKTKCDYTKKLTYNEKKDYLIKKFS